MDIVIRDNYEELSQYAAEVIAGYVKSKPNCVLGFATGSTPLGTYRELIRLHKEGLDFSQVTAFNLDEYLGIGMDLSKPYHLDQSYARFMQEELFKHINIPPDNIYIPDGLTSDPDDYCKWYEEQIEKAGGIDIQILGLGRDGHWAFNEPGSSLASRTRIQALAQETVADNYESFFKKAGVKKREMPKFAITMGIGTILESKNALLLVNGEKKAHMVAKVIEGPLTSQIPASAIQIYSGKIIVVLDREAAAELKKPKHYIHEANINPAIQLND